jgi:catechol 2,3-dioxygenase-like lactoylglutathione lyase family enzyme
MNRLRSILTGVFWIAVCTTAALAETVPVSRVEAVGMTVSDIDRSVDFYTNVLHFQKISDAEVTGEAIEHLKGIFGVMVRVVRLRLGAAELKLSEYFAPQGRALLPDSRSNDLWFQHVAIVLSDMDQAYAWLRGRHIQQVSSGPQTFPHGIQPQVGFRLSTFMTPRGMSSPP